MTAPLREQLKDLNTGGKILLQFTQDRVIDDNLKRQIKTCRLFLPT